MEGGDDVFLIHNTEEAQVDETQADASPEQVRESEAEAMEQVKGLVPLCVQHVHGPELNTAVFGYDIAQMAKRPWAEPDAKLSDYFNYGFNEQSWRVYCAMQANGEASLLAKATTMLQKLEATGRPAGGEAPGAAAAGGDNAMQPPMMGGVEGFHGGPYGNGGGGGYGGGRPFHQPPQRDFHGGGDMRVVHNANYKTRICKAFAEGFCNRGESCNYAHGVAELRQPGGGGGGGGAPPSAGPMGGGPAAPPPQQQQQPQQGPGYGGPNFYPTGSAPPPPPERTANYLMPPFHAGGGATLPPMMQPNMMMPAQEGEGGFRQPPKRHRHDGGGGGGVYEPQY